MKMGSYESGLMQNLDDFNGSVRLRTSYRDADGTWHCLEANYPSWG